MLERVSHFLDVADVAEPIRISGGGIQIAFPPFILPDPATIPIRRWLYGDRLVRGYVSATIATGGVGKSTLTISEALAMTTGRPLLGHRPTAPLRVALWNLEDPREESARRVSAAAKHFGVSAEEIGGRLSLKSGRDDPLVMASMGRHGPELNMAIYNGLVEGLRRSAIDVLVIDPFVSSHRVSENDNGAIDVVVKAWSSVADACGCAVELVHHSRKTGGVEATVEDARGGSAIIGAVRSARVLNVMDAETAEKAGVGKEFRRRYFSSDNGKQNLAPPAEKRTWFHLDSVQLGNGAGPEDGDLVGVVTPWTFPDPLDGVTGADFEAVRAKVAAGDWRDDIRSKQWVGNAVANALGLDIAHGPDREKIKQALRVWFKSGALQIIERPDEFRKPRKFVEVGE